MKLTPLQKQTIALLMDNKDYYLTQSTHGQHQAWVMSETPIGEYESHLVTRVYQSTFDKIFQTGLLIEYAKGKFQLKQNIN